MRNQNQSKKAGSIRNQLNWKLDPPKVNETKSWFFTKISKINKALIKLTEKRKEKLVVSRIKEGISLQILEVLKGS